MNVIDALTSKPKSRFQLCIECGLADRALRREIEALRKAGHPICSSSHKGGYWLGDDTDKKRLVAEYRSRAYSMMKTASAIESGAIDGQERWEL